MKRRSHLFLFALLSFCMVGPATHLSTAQAQSLGRATRHRVVFELNTDDENAWAMLLNNVENLEKALGTVRIEVVTHGKGIAMLTTSKNASVIERLQRIAESGVVFAACENTMAKLQITTEDLSDFVTTVDSGVAEIVRKQEAGWSYLRAGL
jgi:intracellular sulfur oxidation DsrE/DsrF family protein